MKTIKNRTEAGRLLAEKLRTVDRKNTLVLALPRGGVPLAWEIAKQLKLTWDILLVKKIGAPLHPEFAIGAVSEDQPPLWNTDIISSMGLDREQLNQLAEESQEKLRRQSKAWRRNRKPLELEGKDIILVDDGLATGMTMLSAVEFLKHRGARKVTVAAPIASGPAEEALRPRADEVVILLTPEPFFSVGQWYEDFSQVSDEMVMRLLSGRAKNEEDFSKIKIPAQGVNLEGDLIVPQDPKGVVIFAHGSGSTHQSPRNQFVAKALNQLGFATLLFDLLIPEEAKNRANVFDIPLLSERLRAATKWVQKKSSLKSLPIGYFGASTGAAAALMAAAKEKHVSSVVSRGGRPDLAGEALSKVKCPVLLIVGGEDSGVIELNQRAKSQLSKSEIVIVPGAGHLFEEPGTLDEVVEYAGDWFKRTLLHSSRRLSLKPKELVLQQMKERAHPIESEKKLEPLIESLSQSRVVMLGEATHGTEEFYELRKLISERLIEDYGFKFIAVEGDWPDCSRLNKYIQDQEGESATEIMKSFKRWPTWMWANEQTADLIEWMKGRSAGFYGLDVYSLFESLDAIKSYAHKLDPDIGKRIVEAYSCFDFFDRDEIAYAKALIQWPQGCEKEILQNLRELLRLRLEDTHFHRHELFDAQQNAKIIRNAEKYYRSMMNGGAESWNIRDEHMMETLDSLLRYHGEGAKAIVWAHNTHIGDYHATDMIKEGYINLGGLARERYGMENVSLVGFGTYGGEVLAGRAWGARPEIMQLPKAAAGTYEDYLHRLSEEMNSSQFYLDLKGDGALSLDKGHRAVGVVYQPIFESHGKNYVPTKLAQRYDSFIYIDTTSALKALPGQLEKGAIPETWPVGV